MASYSILANTSTSTVGAKMRRGRVRIHATTSVFWSIGENPVASREKCALLRAGETLEIRMPVNCSRLAVLAASESGTVVVTEVAGARSSCSF